MTPHQILTVATFLAFDHITHAESVLVPVTANVYGSGHSGAAATPQPGGGGGGTAPPSIDVLTTTQFGFLGSGSAKFSPSNPTSTNPDGPAGSPTPLNGYNGLSGFTSDHAYALYGVFVGAIEPADPRPAALNFVGNTTFASLSPQLDQVFYIGDGLTGTGSGSTQVFNAPAGALKLYFGLADGVNNPIDNGFYGDNSGAGYLIEISRSVPENLITNGSFENTSATFVNNGQGFMTLAAGSTTIPGWTVINDQITWLLSGGQSFGSTPFGSFFLDLTGTHDNNSFGGVSQTITTTPSKTYTLSVSIGVNQNDAGGNGSKSVSVTAGSSVKSLTFTPSGTGMQWTNLAFNFVATSSATPVSIVGTSSGSGITSLFFDNVSVVPGLPTLTIDRAMPGQTTISWIPATAGYVLQESLSLTPLSWTSSPSGETNPITISATLPKKFYRLFNP